MHTIPQSALKDIHKTKLSELDSHFGGGIMAVFCGGMLFVSVGLFVTAHYYLGVIALGLCILPFIIQAMRRSA